MNMKCGAIDGDDARNDSRTRGIPARCLSATHSMKICQRDARDVETVSVDEKPNSERTFHTSRMQSTETDIANPNHRRWSARRVDGTRLRRECSRSAARG